MGIVQAWEGVAGARKPGEKDERMGCWRGGAERASLRLSRPLSFPSRRGNVDTRPPAIPLSDTSTTIAERIFRRAQATTANYQPPNARVERGTSTTTKEKASPSRPKEKLRARAHAPPAAKANTRCVYVCTRVCVLLYTRRYGGAREREREEETVRCLKYGGSKRDSDRGLIPQVKGEAE